MKVQMKGAALGAFFLLGCGAATAFAGDGDPAGCHELVVMLPKAIADSTETESFADTHTQVCVEESSVKAIDDDGILATGAFTIRVKSDSGRVLKTYWLRARTGDAAAGTIYTEYYASLEEARKGYEGHDAPSIEFRMINDHLKAGDYAGTVKFLDQSYGLRML